jgi:exodeoxyribonuclease-3
MRVASWNINSVRARTDRLVTWLKESSPDVLCLQELKCTDDQFPRLEIEAAGYRAETFGQKTYNGVAVLSKEPATDVLKGLTDGVEDPQSRLVAATVKGVRIISVYAPNGQAVGSPAYQYKLEWFSRLRKYLDSREKPEGRLVICGDWNVAPEPKDVHDPAAWEGQTLYSQPEREALERVRGFGLIDTFRKHHPDDVRFSWWDYQQLAFPKNHGLRIDHLYATAPLAEKCTAADIDRQARKGKLPSDHAPVWAEFDV